MDNYNISNPLRNSKISIFENLKQQQIALNMQIRLAMQLHDTKTQTELEEAMEKITDKMKQIS